MSADETERSRNSCQIARDVATQDYATVLADFMRLGPFPVSSGLLSKMSGVPKATIVNWKTGRVLQPRRWQDVVAVANALRLCIGSTNILLKASGHNNIEQLFADTSEADRSLFDYWQTQQEVLTLSRP